MSLSTTQFSTLLYNTQGYSTLYSTPIFCNTIQFSTTLYNTFRLIIQHRRPTYLSLWPYYQSVIHSEFKTWCRDKSIFKHSISLR